MYDYMAMLNVNGIYLFPINYHKVIHNGQEFSVHELRTMENADTDTELCSRYDVRLRNLRVVD